MTAVAGELKQIRLADLKVHELNPRTDVGDLAELEASIRANGVLEPIVVVKQNGHYAIVAGSRRAAAAKRAQLVEIPAVVRDMDERQIAAAALVENLQRKDLAPLEEAEGYQKYLELTGQTQAELAKVVGKDPSTVSNALRLLKAPAPLKKALEDRSIGAAHARELLKLEDESLMAKVKIGEAKKGTVRDIAAQVDDLNRQWRNTGAPAIARAKQALEDARAAHPKASITWAPLSNWEKQQGEFDLTVALGNPPAPIVGEVHDIRRHDKVCECRGYQLEPVMEYSNTWDADSAEDMDLKGFEVRKRVCVDRAGWAQYTRDGRSSYAAHGSSASKPRQKSEAERAKEKQARERQRRENIARHIQGKSENGYYSDRAPSPEIFKKLVAGGWSSDKVARLLLLSYATEHVWTSAEMPEIVRGVMAMPAAKARDLVMQRAAARVQSYVLSKGGPQDPFDRQVAKHELLTAYGAKSTEPQRKTKKAKKEAKR